MRTLNLYYNDLTPEAQKKYLKVQGVSSASELNWEVTPLAIIEVEEETPEEILKGSFVSVWDDGSVISTEATLNPATGEVTTTPIEGDIDHGSLEREYFESEGGLKYEVCPTCHEYLLKRSVNPDQVGKGLSEVKTCFNPDCESMPLS
jgi:hypothetical protein